MHVCDLPSLRKTEHLLSSDDVADQVPESKREKSFADGAGADIAVIQHLQVANNKAVEAIDGGKHEGEEEGVDDEDNDFEEEKEVVMNIDPVTASTTSPLNQSIKRLLQSENYIKTISNTTQANAFPRQLQLSSTNEKERLYTWFCPYLQFEFPLRDITSAQGSLA